MTEGDAVPFRVLPRLNDANRDFWQGGEHGECAAELERASALKVLRLQGDGQARVAAERPGAQHRSLPHHPGPGPRRTPNAVERHSRGVLVAAESHEEVSHRLERLQKMKRRNAAP